MAAHVPKPACDTGRFVWLALVSLFITGCGMPRSDKPEPLEGGYTTKSYSRGFIHVSGRLELEYNDKKHHVVWPDIADVTINGDTALFLGWERAESGAGDIRLFVYRPPGPAVDITRQVLTVGAKQRGLSLQEVPASARVATLKKVQEGVELSIALVDWPDRNVELDWNQIEHMMRNVKANGHPQTLPGFQTPYVN
jgi:hypothetical protein